MRSKGEEHLGFKIFQNESPKGKASLEGEMGLRKEVWNCQDDREDNGGIKNGAVATVTV